MPIVLQQPGSKRSKAKDGFGDLADLRGPFSLVVTSLVRKLLTLEQVSSVVSNMVQQ